MTTTVQIGKGLSIDIDFGAMPQAALDHVLYIGARNILMDAHASITKETNPTDLVDAALAMSEKKLAALMAGEVRVSTARESVDPVRAEALRMASAIVTAKIRKAGKKVGDYEKADLRAAAEKVLAADATIIEKAKARVAELASSPASTTDLADLGL